MLADFGWKAAKWPGGPNKVESVVAPVAVARSDDDLLEDDDDPDPGQLDGWGPNMSPPVSEDEESDEEVDPDECCKLAPGTVPDAVDVNIGGRLVYPGIRP